MLRNATRFASLAIIVGLTAATSHASLVITEVMSSSGAGGTGDWFELTNTGSSAYDLTGFKMDDNSYGVPATAEVALAGVTSIPAGKSAVFIEATSATSGATDIAAFRTFWGGAAATADIGSYFGSGVSLSSTADGVTIFDATGTEIPGIRVSFGAATTGKTFGYSNGVFGGISTAGVDGAYTSANALANVGSPGVIASAVAPEPASLATLGLIAGVFGRRRRA